jgi:hypothetical protein
MEVGTLDSTENFQRLMMKERPVFKDGKRRTAGTEAKGWLCHGPEGNEE